MSEYLNKKELHFIIGIGRSGTTILSKLLNNHPQIHCLPEANFMVFFLHEYQNKNKISTLDIDLIFKQIALYGLSHPWIGWEFDMDGTKAELIKECDSSKGLSYLKLCETIFINFKPNELNKDNAKIIIDKNPSYTIFTKHISKVFPNAKFIFLVRDYRANVLSRKQNMNLKSPDIAFNAFRWRLFNKQALRYLNANKKKVLLVRYEEFVKNNKFEMQKICNFLEVDVNEIKTSEKPLDRVKFSDYNIGTKFKERFEKKYNDLDKPLNADRLDAWKSQMSATEIRVCDAICSNLGKKLGYLPFYKLSRIHRMVIQFWYLIPMIKAYSDVMKDLLIYYFPAKYKLNRLQKIYNKIDFIKK